MTEHTDRRPRDSWSDPAPVTGIEDLGARGEEIPRPRTDYAHVAARSTPSMGRGVVWSQLLAEMERDHEERLRRAAPQDPVEVSGVDHIPAPRRGDADPEPGRLPDAA